MKRILLSAAFALLCLSAPARDIPWDELRGLVSGAQEEEIDFHINKTYAAQGTIRQSVPIEDDLVLEGIVITNPDNVNKDIHFAIHYTTSHSGPNGLCTYMESPDGKYGIRLNVLKTVDLAPFQRYHRVRLNLKGLTLVKEGPSYILTNVSASCVEKVSYGDASSLPQKRKRISELTDDDIFTWVSLSDCEFVFKDGAYVNIYEEYGRSGGVNVPGIRPNNAMNCWASEICDSDASTIYMLLNSRVPWRRTGTGVPQGAGTLSGIVVKTYLPRYGLKDTFGIRPLEQEDVDFAWGGSGAFKTIAEWRWSNYSKAFKTTTGEVEDIVAQGILPEIGSGELSTDLPSARIFRGKEFNNTVVVAPRTPKAAGDRGAVNYGAMKIATAGKNWWNWQQDCGNSVIITTSTKGMEGSLLWIAFSFSAGNQLASNSAFYPTYWCVEYSADGLEYFRSPAPDAILRSLPWYTTYGNVAEATYHISSEAGMGYTDHLFPLPASLLGKDKIWIRISPSRKVVSSLSFREQDDGVLTPFLEGECMVNFGTIKIAYR